MKKKWISIADGQDVLWTCEVPTTGSVTVMVTGFLIES